MTHKRKKVVKWLYDCRCERCGHEWETKEDQLPLTCPKCKSPYWNRPRRS